jgi:hypothetical protein
MPLQWCISISDSGHKEENADVVNVRFNLVLVAMYRKNDSYDNLCRHYASVAQQIDIIRTQGITMNGRHWRVKLPVGGDIKMLSAIMGLCGCNSKWPCMVCKSSTHEFHKHKAQ